MFKELHIMLDLETLSTRANAAILEVGYAIFETQVDKINQSGTWHLSLEEQLAWGPRDRHVSAATLTWWAKQSDAARENAFQSLPRTAPRDFFMEFAEQIPWHNIQGCWSHGLGFDIPILETFHQQYKQIVPWHYRTPRDTRTLFWLAGLTKEEFVQSDLAHSAEHDAIAQALTVQRAMKRISAVSHVSDLY